MNATVLHESAPATRVPTPNGGRASLLKLYLVRGLLAVAWAAVFAGAHATLDTVAIVLLVAYPLIDAVSSLIDYAAAFQGVADFLTETQHGLPRFIAIVRGRSLP